MSMSFFNRYFLLECKEQLQNNISGEKTVGCDGETVTNTSIDVRHIEIAGFFDAALNRRAMEGELKKVFNVGCAGTLEYYHKKDKKRYTISCSAEKMPDVSFANARVEFVVSLKCADPFWYGEEISLAIPKYSLAFENAGDSSAGAVIELTGTANEPVISCGVKRIAFKNNLSNQTLKIISMPDSSRVEVDGVNAIRYLTDSSQRGFFLLDIGMNTVSYSAKSGANGLSARLIYKPRYLGAF